MCDSEGIKPISYSISQILDGNGNPQVIPDINVYQQKKNLAQGMMDLALLSANANQLRYVVETYEQHPYYWFSLISISISLILQVSLVFHKFGRHSVEDFDELIFTVICVVMNYKQS